MNNKFIKIVAIFSLVLFTILCFSRAITVKADSGWDSDYDSGSSWDSGGWDSNYDSSFNWNSHYDSRSSRDSRFSNGYDIDIWIAIGIEVFATMPYYLLFFRPFSELKNKEDKKKTKRMIWFMFVIRALVLILLDSISPSFAWIDLCMPFLLVLLPMALIGKATSQSKVNNIKNHKQISDSEANKILPGIDIPEFNYNIYKMFYDVQIGWMNFDYDKLRPLLTDELYNTYVMDLEALKLKNQKNVMRNFELIDAKLIELKEENNRYIAKVLLEVKFIDYIEDINHKVLRGSNYKKLNNTYIITCERSKSENVNNICPNCGAKVEGNSTGICEYCNSKLINTTYNWVISKKEKISQR